MRAGFPMAVMLGWLTVGGSLLGCAQPHVQFLRGECQAERSGQRITRLVFIASFEARQLQEQQIIYLARLFGRNSQSIRSRDGRYETGSGAVAATRTLIVFEPVQLFKKVRVSIPASELELEEGDLPARAELAVYSLEGRRLGGLICDVPIRSVSQIQPPLTDPATLPVSHWFADLETEGWPILVGPFASRAEASQALTGGAGTVHELTELDFVWFIPLVAEGPPERTSWWGPCVCQEDAERVAAGLRQRFAGADQCSAEMGWSPVKVGRPVSLALADGFARQVRAQVPE